MADETTKTVTQQVQELIEEIRVHLQADGGDIELVKMEEETGVVSVKLQGACKGCPGAAMTLKMGVQRYLKEHVPEVTEVVAVKD
jgi:Fe-S cluster biogenesis protein NfuA